MEPADLTPPLSEEQIETWLKANSATALSDDGFSHRVLAALPPQPARGAVISRDGLVWVAGGMLGLAVSLSQGSGVEDWGALAQAAQRSLVSALEALNQPVAYLTLTVIVGSLGIAFWQALAQLDES